MFTLAAAVDDREILLKTASQKVFLPESRARAHEAMGVGAAL